MVYGESNEINGEKNCFEFYRWEKSCLLLIRFEKNCKFKLGVEKKKFDPEGKTIAPPHVSNGPPLTVTYQLQSWLCTEHSRVAAELGEMGVFNISLGLLSF